MEFLEKSDITIHNNTQSVLDIENCGHQYFFIISLIYKNRILSALQAFLYMQILHFLLNFQEELYYFSLLNIATFCHIRGHTELQFVETTCFWRLLCIYKRPFGENKKLLQVAPVETRL